MVNLVLKVIIVLIAMLLPHRAEAQAIPEVGVVWQPPTTFEAAASDLRKIQQTGFTAVRTDVIQDERLLILADELGLRLYQELPIQYLTATGVADSLDVAMQALTSAINTGREHRSATAFGLGRFMDTSEPATCAALERLVEHGRSIAPPSTRFYYVTLFTSDDMCSEAVDLVLIDGPDQTDPTTRLRMWHAAHDTPVGLAGVGSWVRADAPEGLQNLHSPQQQGQFLEQSLNDLLIDRLAPSSEIVFVYRWRDADTELPLIARGVPNPYGTRYGLHDADMNERPAFEVVSGIISGRQFIFAFPYGEETSREWPWTVIFGWISLLMVGLATAFSPRLQQMVPRYFLAHGFYRDALREGRELLQGGSFVILLAIGLAAGVTFALSIELIQEFTAFRVLLGMLPENVVHFLASTAARPWVIILLVGAIYAGMVLAWVILMMLLSMTRFALGAGQVMMLVVWPRWPLLVLMPFGLALLGSTESLTDNHLFYGVALLAGFCIITTLVAVIRAVVDFTAISRVPGYVPVLLLLLNPAIIITMITVFAWLQYQDEMRFLVHILQRL